MVLYLGPGDNGEVKLDDQASVPAELGSDLDADLSAINWFIDVAVEGRATAFQTRRGGCLEVRTKDVVSRTWRNAAPLPGWRRRAERIDYAPYK